MLSHKSKQNGFTLIEVIASLIIMGFIGSIAGMGIVHIVDGYVVAKEGSAMVQKGRIAISRITKEFQFLTKIVALPTPTHSGISYFRENQNYTLSFQADLGQIFLNDDLLLDNVKDFSLAYYDQYDDPKPDPSDLTAGFSENTKLVDIQLELNGPQNTTHQLETRVFLRGLVEGR
jgi:prepilin-type N-terminal cleavage/methylation domain-containing protein